MNNGFFAYGLNSNTLLQGQDGSIGEKGVFLYLCDYDGYVQKKLITDRIKLNLSLNDDSQIIYNDYDKFVDINNNIFEIKNKTIGSYEIIGELVFDYFIETYNIKNFQRLSNDYISEIKYVKDNVNYGIGEELDPSVYNINLYDSSICNFLENNISNQTKILFKTWTNGVDNIGFIAENDNFNANWFKFGNGNDSGLFDKPLIMDFKNIIIDYDQTNTNMLITNNNVNGEQIYDNLNLKIDGSVFYLSKDASDPSIYYLNINNELDEFDKELLITWDDPNQIATGLNKKTYFINANSNINQIKCLSVALKNYICKLTIFNKFGWSRTFINKLFET